MHESNAQQLIKSYKQYWIISGTPFTDMVSVN